MTPAYLTREHTDLDMLLAALDRLLTGVLGHDSGFGCEWYEGLAEDATDEARALLARAETEEE